MVALRSQSLPVRLVPYRPEYEHWVLSSWINRAERDPRANPGVYTSELEALIKRMLVNPRVRMQVLEDAATPGLGIGWICHSADALHFVFVKPGFRRMGFARHLLFEAFGGISPRATTFTSRDLPKLRLDATYSPFLLSTL